MADYDLDELRTLQDRARAAIAAAEAACSELRTIDGAIGSVVNRMLAERQQPQIKRSRAGPQQREIAKFLKSAGALPGQLWINFRDVAAALPTSDRVSLRGSLEDGRGRFFEQQGDGWRLLDGGLKISD